MHARAIGWPWSGPAWASPRCGALVEDLPDGVHVVALLRASNHHEAVLAEEMRVLFEHRSGQLPGPRRTSLGAVRLDTEALGRFVPDLTSRDIFVCGPHGFTRQVVRSARALGVDRDRIHTEAFVT